MTHTIAAIDVGTTKICTLIAEVSDNGTTGPRIAGVGITPSRGLRKGVVVNVTEATEAIAASVEKAERLSGYQVESAYVGVAGSHISSINSRGTVAISRGERGITQEDVDRALEAAQAIAIPHNREIIHTIPRGFTIDGQNGVREPVGLKAYRLEVEAHIATAASASVHNLVKCVQGAGVNVHDLVLQPLAAGEAVLTATEREMGVVLADIGGGTTDIAIFIEDSVWHTTILAVGGMHLTNDLAIGLRTHFTAAEEAKIKYGHAVPDSIVEDEMIEVAAFGDTSRQPVSRRQVASIIEARAEEIFGLIRQEIKRSGYDGLLPAGVVLCGGTAGLAGIKDLGREVLDLPVRVGAPHDLEGMVDVLHNPAYATSVGLLLWGMADSATYQPKRRSNGWLRRLGGWFRAFLPG